MIDLKAKAEDIAKAVPKAQNPAKKDVEDAVPKETKSEAGFHQNQPKKITRMVEATTITKEVLEEKEEEAMEEAMIGIIATNQTTTIITTTIMTTMIAIMPEMTKENQAVDTVAEKTDGTLVAPIAHNHHHHKIDLQDIMTERIAETRDWMTTEVRVGTQKPSQEKI
ncbi:uncharacterized protein MELLADRAFT_105760 [Melampsora larici-populina 98AG31]|uniref:Uncharacterized protein n=1 Tax=Melampsora larici-populina (strain 98AG31 / pathotype 3-4-7) TaxID=747676 RepID=F4RJ85_MELLP|nr:uncharacterized protein MELLADRAFT_105760 [Melampsora larici-populina 98AG31]EGG07275.1 hypothetical protein MELLADRAFT_105760 [Melampsora larici-populina 98AG31]